MQLKNITTIIKNHVLIEDLDMYIAESTTKPEEVLDDVQENPKMGIYFLDVDLDNSELNGFALAQEIRKIDNTGYIIFVTTHDELVFQTFQYKVAALEYILKDDPKKMEKSIVNCFKTIEAQLANKNQHTEFLQVLSNGRALFIELPKVTYFEAVGAHKIIAHSLDKRTSFNGDLKSIESSLPINFTRCHRSFIVNLKFVDAIDKTENIITLTNGSTCYISRRKIKETMQKLEQL